MRDTDLNANATSGGSNADQQKERSDHFEDTAISDDARSSSRERNRKL